jgi:predicted XRE-type DNA-binding protein
MEEKWKVISDFPDYAVSNIGRVKRVTDSNNRKAGFVLKPSFWNNRYASAILYKDKKYYAKSIHSLVLTAFVCERPTLKHHCNHINGNKRDNRLENLEWVTPRENNLHAVRTGLRKDEIGENNMNKKLKKCEVWLIKKLLHHKISQYTIAKMFNVTRPNITSINCGKTWKEVVYES